MSNSQGRSAQQSALRTTPLHPLHQRLQARFGEFAGYDMPIQYPEGIMAEHRWTREHAGLFDVSHMGPCFLELTTSARGAGAHEEVAALLEPLICADVRNLAPGEQKLTLMLSQEGGILDDLMVARLPGPEDAGRLYIVVNAGVKEADFARIAEAAGTRARLVRADDRALLALQGPLAAEILSGLAPEIADMAFMTARRVILSGSECVVSRSGYTGEDGFEILMDATASVGFAEQLLADPRVKMIGLGARDSLRLEAGLCLYGHDLSPDTSPVEAGLSWTIPRSRRRAADFPGASRILSEIAAGPPRKRVGLRPLGKAPAREGAEVRLPGGPAIGTVTSGGFGPTVGAPIAMGYVESSAAITGTRVELVVRGKPLEAEITALPFVEHRYRR